MSTSINSRTWNSLFTYWKHKKEIVHQSHQEIFWIDFWIQIWVSVDWEDKNIQFPHMTIERQWYERANMNEFWHGILKLKTICKNHLKVNINFDILKLE
jgi:hypothetical protein